MMEAIILAGGLGTRLRSMVSDVPKPMAPIGELPFLAHLLTHWQKQGVSKAVLAVGYQAEKISSYFGDRFREIPIEYSLETSPLGTAGAIRQAIRRVQTETCLILNGDTYAEVALADLGVQHYSVNAELSFSVGKVDFAQRYGGLTLGADNRISSFASTTNENEINAGVYLMQRAFAEQILPTDISLEKDCFPRWLAEGRRLFGWRLVGKFIDIGIPEDYLAAKRMLLSQRR